MPRKRTIPRVCEQCGDDFLAYTDQVNRGDGRFCSRTCTRRPRTAPVAQEDGAAGIPLRARDGSVRAYVIVDAADAERANRWRWSLNNTGYAIRGQSIDGILQKFLLHREILGLTPGDGWEVDHIDHDRLNCRRANMRTVLKAENAQNASAKSTSTSQHRGVSWNTGKQRWVAQVGANGKTIHLGYFATETEAAEAAWRGRRRFLPFSVD